jgi:hypothetical protein
LIESRATAGRIGSEFDSDRLRGIRLRFRRRAARPVRSQHIARGHLSADTKDVVKLGIALIATMAALVLGLLTASAKSTYDTRRNQLLQVSADIILVDRLLANYGPETKEARAMLQRSVTVAIEQFWPENGGQPVNIDRRTSSVEALFDNIQRLSPQSDSQRCKARH